MKRTGTMHAEGRAWRDTTGRPQARGAQLPTHHPGMHEGARTTRILLADKHGSHAVRLKEGLIDAGYATDVVANADAARERLLHNAYGLLILDVLLPGVGESGLDGAIARNGARCAVLLMLRHEGVDHRARKLAVSADDFIVWPFTMAKLLARVRTLLRNANEAESPCTLQVADLVLDLRRCSAIRGGRRIDLTAGEFALLELLMRRSGELVRRSTLATHVWGVRLPSDDSSISGAIRRLRAKVDEGFAPRLIHTVRGMGYVLETVA